MTYEVKTPLALSVTRDEKQFWGFNAVLITAWSGAVLNNEVFTRLRRYDHQCLKVKTTNLHEGLAQILRADLALIQKEFSISLVSAWLKIEPDQLLQI